MAAAGVLLTVHVAPVLAGRLVAFAVEGVEGRWLPWTTLGHGANPYEIASTIVDEWCDGAMADLRLVDVISQEGEEGWELAIVFRAELTAAPRGERGAPHPCDAQDLAAIHGFTAVDLERWRAAPASGAAAGAGAKAEVKGSRLLF